jgi:hypothetical protein
MRISDFSRGSLLPAQLPAPDVQHLARPMRCAKGLQDAEGRV